MQLMLIVTTPGADITPTANGFGDISWALSSDSSLLKHAVTPRKLEVGVAGQMTSSSCVGEGVFGGVGVFCGVAIVFDDSVQGIQTTLSFLSLGPLDGWGISPASTTGLDGCNTFSQPRNLDTSSPQLVLWLPP